jgi:hypothetical protein
MRFKHLFREEIKLAAKESGLPKDVVYDIYISMWKFVRKTTEKLPIKDCNSEEDFKHLRASFNFKFFGKFYTNYKKKLATEKRLTYLKTLKNGTKIKKDHPSI